MDFLFKTLLLSLFSVSALASSQPDFADNCLGCHGAQNRELEYQAPQLAGLKKSYILKQLQSYRDGLRGKGSKAAAEMASAVQQYDDKQLKKIADWASDLEGKALLSYAKESKDPGAVIFINQCQGCHESFMGRLMTSSPRLEYLSGDYMVAQLNLFRSGERQIQDPGKHQKKMLTVTRALSDSDLAALKTFLLAHAGNKTDTTK